MNEHGRICVIRLERSHLRIQFRKLGLHPGRTVSAFYPQSLPSMLVLEIWIFRVFLKKDKPQTSAATQKKPIIPKSRVLIILEQSFPGYQNILGLSD